MFDMFSLYQNPFSPDYWGVFQKAGKYYDKIQETFSQDFFNDFFQAHQDLSQMERDEAYREGFQDGVLFMTRSFLSLPDWPKTPSP